MSKKGLGKGLGALLNTEEPESLTRNGLTVLKINQVEPNLNQPRRTMDDTKLYELSESIKHHGVVQPIIVNQENGIFRIVAGERRWRAARMAGLTEVPVIIKELSDKQAMEIALIENIQREDLNPLEEAEALERLIQDHQITHEELSGIIGKSRPAISNTLRLLGLCPNVKEMLVAGLLSTGHARALLAIEDEDLQTRIAKQVVQTGASVRETENIISKLGKTRSRRKGKNLIQDFEYIVNDMQEIFGTKVKILSGKNNKGKITIEYYSKNDLERIFDMVTGLKPSSH